MEVVKQGTAAWNRDDFDVWIDQYDPEVEWFALMEVFHGHTGARQAWDTKSQHGFPEALCAAARL